MTRISGCVAPIQAPRDRPVPALVLGRDGDGLGLAAEPAAAARPGPRRLSARQARAATETRTSALGSGSRRAWAAKGSSTTGGVGGRGRLGDRLGPGHRRAVPRPGGKGAGADAQDRRRPRPSARLGVPLVACPPVLGAALGHWWASHRGTRMVRKASRWAFSPRAAPTGRVAGLGLVEQLVEFGGGADVAVADLALGVDQEHRRQGDDPVLVGDLAVHPLGLQDLRPGEAVVLEVRLDGGLVGVEADAEDFQPLVLVLRLDLRQFGKLATARVGGARPEEDQERLALELRGVHGLALGALARQLDRLADEVEAPQGPGGLLAELGPG